MAYSNAFKTPLPGPSTTTTTTTPRARGTPSASSSSFAIDRGLINPRFEAYRLIQEEAGAASSPAIVPHPLPSKPYSLKHLHALDALGSASAPQRTLGYKEAKERALHSFLVPARATPGLQQPGTAADTPVAGYIDENGFVVLISLIYDDAGQATKIVGHPVHRLELDGPEPADKARSLPSLISLHPTQWVASNGRGSLTLITIGLAGNPTGPRRWISTAATSWTVGSSTDETARPFTLVTAEMDDEGRAHVLVQTCRKSMPAEVGRSSAHKGGLGFSSSSKTAPTTSAQSPSTSETVFDIRLVVLDLSDESESRQAHVQWCVVGSEPLLWARLDTAGNRHVLAAEAEFALPHESGASGGKDSGAPGEDASPSGVHAESRSAAAGGNGVAFRPRRPPHYSWAQTPDTLTVAFSLPATIAKSDIRVHFSFKGISLSLADSAPQHGRARITEIVDDNDDDAAGLPTDTDDPLEHAANLVRSGRYVSRALWGEIDPSGSVWTWERVVGNAGPYKDRAMGVLTLHLEKKHEGTRWMQVFADRRQPPGADQASSWEQVSKKTRLSFQEARERAERVRQGDEVGVPDEQASLSDEDDGEDDEDDVPETLDPSELINMLEGMEKYTIYEDRMDAARAGTGTDRTQLSDQPSLLRDGLEEDDDNVGRPLVVSWVVASSTTNGPAGIRIERPAKDATEARRLLALPLPTSASSRGDPTATPAPQPIVVKHDLDGAVFIPPRPTSSALEWKHDDTLSALAFVLASKRDANRVFVHRPAVTVAGDGVGSSYASAVLAFESAPQLGLDAAAQSTGAAGEAGNLFVYHSPSSAGGVPRDFDEDRAKYGQSRVLRLGGGGGASGSGALVGVVAVPTEGSTLLLCLCERSALLIRNVL